MNITTDTEKNHSSAIPRRFLPPNYIRRRYPALQRLEENPVFMLSVRRRSRPRAGLRGWLFFTGTVALAFLLGFLSIKIDFVKQYSQYFGLVWLVFWGLYILIVPKKDRRSNSIRRLMANCTPDLLRELYQTDISPEDAAFGAAAGRLSRESIGLRFFIVGVLMFIYIYGSGAILRPPLSWFVIQAIVLFPAAALFLNQIDRIFFYFRSIALYRFLLQHHSGLKDKIQQGIRIGGVPVLIWLAMSMLVGIGIALSMTRDRLVAFTILNMMISAAICLCVGIAYLYRDRIESRFVALYGCLLAAIGRDDEMVDLKGIMRKAEK